jgi:regulator of replication initiation timing
MAKQTKKQIKAQLRAELTDKIGREYQDKIDSLKRRLSDANAEVRRLYTNNQDLREENANLKGEVAKLKEWAERMQQFCNMSDEDRKAELERIRVDGNFTQLMDDLSAYTKFFFGGANLPLY